MSGDTTFEQIGEGAFYSLLQQYQDVVPKKLNALDEQRYSIIPEALNARTGDPHLLKDEVVTLVKWKLYGSPFPFVFTFEVPYNSHGSNGTKQLVMAIADLHQVTWQIPADVASIGAAE